jgi:hypothetical protein
MGWHIGDDIAPVAFPQRAEIAPWPYISIPFLSISNQP